MQGICDICGRYITEHDYRCPNYIEENTGIKCELCKESIFHGEEFIENHKEKVVHLDCVFNTRWLLEFLDVEISVVE